jgi:dihydroorotase-like cyclic amidohydrolase
MMIMPLREFDKMESTVKQQMTKSAMGSLDGRIDVVATDHAYFGRKKQPYLKAPSGGPLVQHAVVAMFESFHQGKISIEKIVEKNVP